jgi:hypothetical protein
LSYKNPNRKLSAEAVAAKRPPSAAETGNAKPNTGRTIEAKSDRAYLFFIMAHLKLGVE